MNVEKGIQKEIGEKFRETPYRTGGWVGGGVVLSYSNHIWHHPSTLPPCTEWPLQGGVPALYR